MPRDHIEFFDRLRLCHHTPDCVCTHGGLDPRIVAFCDQPRRALIWGANTFPDGYQGRETVVYGHHNNGTLNENGWPMPTVIGKTIGIDTVSYGVLTAIRLPDFDVFQSAQYDGGRG